MSPAKRARTASLVAGPVAGQGGHDAVGDLLGEARRIGRCRRTAAGPRPQAAESPPKRAAGLGGEPVPVAGQEGHLAGGDAEPGAAAGRFRGFGGRGEAGDRLVGGAPEIEIHSPAGGVRRGSAAGSRRTGEERRGPPSPESPWAIRRSPAKAVKVAARVSIYIQSFYPGEYQASGPTARAISQFQDGEPHEVRQPAAIDHRRRGADPDGLPVFSPWCSWRSRRSS